MTEERNKERGIRERKKRTNIEGINKVVLSSFLFLLGLGG